MSVGTKRVWALITHKTPAVCLLSLMACQPLSPGTPSSAVSLPDASAAIGGPRASTAQPLATPAPWGPRLENGTQVTVLTPAQSRRLMLLANPHDREARVNFQVFPTGEAVSPVATPAATESPGRRGVPPFGFGFDGASRGTFGVGARRLLNAGPAAARHVKFWINDGSATLEGDRQRQATLRLESDNALFYVDDAAGSSVRDDRIAHLAEALNGASARPSHGCLGSRTAQAPMEKTGCSSCCLPGWVKVPVAKA